MLLVTVMPTVPAEPAGVVAVMLVALLTVTEVEATPPKVTFAPARNPVPVSVTVVPPAAAPLAGETAVKASEHT